MKTIRVFISSPGDVHEEREIARQVVQGLRRRYAAYFDLKPVLWELLPLQADAAFQQGVDLFLSKEHGIDVAVFILWSRLGSPLGSLIRKDDGTEYRSGTEREFDLILKAREASGGERPHVIVYTRSDDAGFKERLRSTKPSEKEQILSQKKLVESFIREEFHDAERGTNLRAYHTFNQPATFSTRLRAHLQEMLDGLCDGLSPDPVWDIDEKGPPFRGLMPFEFEHSVVFFGREDEIVSARTAIQEAAKNGCAFLLITGASGAGKSSLARAGILPAISENEIDDEVTGWRHAIFLPSEISTDCHAGIAAAILKAVPEIGQRISPDQFKKEFEQDIQKSITEHLLPALRLASKNQKGVLRLVVLADQLEELFTVEGFGSYKREQFTVILDALARSGEIWVLATVRGDFYMRCQELPVLMQMKADGSHVDVLAPKVDAIRRMIESPATLAGLSYERMEKSSLADLILSEAANQNELLPLLQDLLSGLFDRRTEQGVLLVSAYRELGGISGALAKRAEETYLLQPDEIKNAFSEVLRQLVSLDEQNDDGRGAIRRWAPISSFAEGTDSRRLVDVFVQQRLLVADQSSKGEPCVAVVHEALLRVWPRVTAWLEENKEFLRQRARLTQALAHWKTQDSHEDYLLARGLPLAQAEDLLRRYGEILGEEERNFIEASQSKALKEIKRATRLRRMIVGVVSSLVLLAGVAGVAGYLKNAEAAREKKSAEARQIQAEAYYDVHSARLAGERGNFRDALKLASKAFLRHKDFTTRSAILSALKLSPERLQTSITGFGGAVTLMEFSSNGSLAVADAQGALRVVDINSSPIKIESSILFEEREQPLILALAYSSLGWKAWREDGSQIATNTREISVKEKQTLLLAFQSGGSLQAAVYPSAPMEVELSQRNDSTLATLGKFALPARVSALALSAEGKLAAGTSTGEVFLLSPGTENISISPPNGKKISSLSWEKGGDGRLAAGGLDGNLMVFQIQAEIKTHKRLLESKITCVEWSPAGGYLAASRSDGGVTLLNFSSLEEPTLVAELKGHSGPALSLAWNEDSKILASGGEDGAVCIWSPFGWPGPFKSVATKRDLRSLSVSPDGNLLAVGSNEGMLLFFNAESLVQNSEIMAEQSMISALDWNSKSELLASGDSYGSIRIWKPSQNEPVQTYKVPVQTEDNTIWRVKWSADPQLLAYSSHSGLVELINTTSNEQSLVGRLADLGLGLAWKPEGTQIAVGSTDGLIRIWNTSAKEAEPLVIPKESLAHKDSIGSIAFSKNGTCMASCGNDGIVAIWNSSDWSLKARTTPVNNYLEDLAFSPEGSLLAAVGADGYLRVWQNDASPWFAIEMSKDHLWNVDWNPNGVFCVGTNGNILSLDTSENDWVYRANEIVGFNVSDQK